MAVDLCTYLEAKAALDDRSLNPAVLGLLLDRLGARERVRLLEVGCGTGAHLCRLAGRLATGEMELAGVDRDVDLIRVAPALCRRRLEARGWTCRQRDGRLVAEREGRVRHLAFVHADLWAFAPDAGWDAVCAHTFLDLVPVARVLAWVASRLVPGGLLYATCNYDGGTCLFPPGDGFEERLLAAYDASMEARRVGGEATGGAASGRRLFLALQETGWEVLAYGSSDWNLTPVAGGYRDADAGVLKALVEMIHAEGLSAGLAARELRNWRQARLTQLREGRLGMVIHQLDVLAARP